MTDQLPAVLPSGAIATAGSVDTYIVPVLVAASGAEAIDRFLNFFASQIENDNTREAARQSNLRWWRRCGSPRGWERWGVPEKLRDNPMHRLQNWRLTR
jgi:hypothetical protein